MKSKLFQVAAATALTLGLGLAVVMLAFPFRVKAVVGLPVYEMPVSPNGSVYEVNRDAQGKLWVSDYDAGEIWLLDPAARLYTRYRGFIKPGDARPDGSGSVWYANGSADYLGQLDVATGAVTLWETAGAGGLYATQVDSDGNIWATSWSNPLVYRFNPDTKVMCSYALPSLYPSQYLAANDQGIWLADSNGASIFRLEPDPNPTLNQYTIWDLPVSSSSWPVGLEPDANGNLWWAEYALGSLHRLEDNPPGEDDWLTTYVPPVASRPVMLDASGSLVRFSDDDTGPIGSLDPSAPTDPPVKLKTSTQPVTPDCTPPLDPTPADSAKKNSGRMDFTPASYTNLADSAGWKIWQAPDGGLPYGVRLSGKSVWRADYYRKVMIWEFSGTVVSACTLADQDGNPATTADQTPLEGWRVYLEVDGVRQEPGELTSEAGCYTWLDLDSGHTYAVEEVLQEGWEALTPVTVDFGAAVEGQLYQNSFINTVEVDKIYLPLVIR